MRHFGFSFCEVPLHSLQDLGLQSRDWTQATAVKVLSPNCWTAKEFPFVHFSIGFSG